MTSLSNSIAIGHVGLQIQQHPIGSLGLPYSGVVFLVPDAPAVLF